MKESQICIALDFQTKNEVENFLDQFGNEQLYVKVGMELFYGEGIEKEDIRFSWILSYMIFLIL